MKKTLRPCIRDLKIFRKTGCPEKPWDGKEGCPAWVQYLNDEKIIVLENCMTILAESHFSMEILKSLDGNYKVNESLRNGLCEVVGNETVPKPDRGLMHLIMTMTKQYNEKLTGGSKSEHILIVDKDH